MRNLLLCTLSDISKYQCCLFAINLYNKFINIFHFNIFSIYKNKIKSKIENKTYLLQKVKIDKEVNGSVNHIECSNCGASVNILEKKCSYCGSEYNYLQEWYLVKEL